MINKSPMKMEDKITGIYKIVSPDNKVYVGRTVNCLKRRNDYKYGKCKKQPKLYASICKYGWSAHYFEVIRVCDESELNDLEVYYSNLLNSRDSKLGLNTRECGGSKGKHSAETIEKCRLAKKGKKNTPKHIANVQRSLGKLRKEGRLVVWNKGKKGVQVMSDQTKEKIRKKMTGKKRSAAHRQNCKLRFMRERSSPDWNSEGAKRKRSVKSGRFGQEHRLSIMVVNTETGIFYETIKQAWDSCRLQSLSTFGRKVTNNGLAKFLCI